MWINAGATEVATQRLLILGAKWQKGALGEIYRDPEAVSVMVRSLESLLPGANPAAVFHGCPEAALVCVDRNALSAQLVALRTGVGIARFDLARVVDATLTRRCCSCATRRGNARRAPRRSEPPSSERSLGTRASPRRSRCARRCWRRPRRTSSARSRGSGTTSARNWPTSGARRFDWRWIDTTLPARLARGGVIGEMTDGDKKEAARETGMRHAVDYAGRVAEPYLDGPRLRGKRRGRGDVEGSRTAVGVVVVGHS